MEEREYESGEDSEKVKERRRDTMRQLRKWKIDAVNGKNVPRSVIVSPDGTIRPRWEVDYLEKALINAEIKRELKNTFKEGLVGILEGGMVSLFGASTFVEQVGIDLEQVKRISRHGLGFKTRFLTRYSTWIGLSALYVDKIVEHPDNLWSYVPVATNVIGALVNYIGKKSEEKEI